LKRIAIGLQYDGQAWHGYQKQDHGLTVQDKLEQALLEFATVPLATTCAGRTDAGVHASEQIVHFDTDLNRLPHAWVRGVNAFLPPSIGVRWAKELEGDPAEENFFHARFSAQARTYHYVLYNNQVRSPLLNGRAGFYHHLLDAERMQEAARALVGMHDFTTFRAAHCQAKSPVKLMHDIQIRRQGDLIIFTLKASAFLHHMVRNLVGSLVYIGQGREDVTWMAELLAAKNRQIAAPTFMPDGLYLAKIDYDEKWALPQETSSQLPWF
jgi:tRNA pseudouridine38-40 synthase